MVDDTSQSQAEKMSKKQGRESYKKESKLDEEGLIDLVVCKSDRKKAVIKFLDVAGMDEQQKQDAYTNARLLLKLAHPNVVRHREVFPTKKDQVCVVTEYCEMGDLCTVIQTRARDQNYFSEDEVLFYFAQLCLGLKHIHDKKMMHRAISSQHILLKQEGPLAIAKYCSFTVAKVFEKTLQMTVSAEGQQGYVSPEVMEGKEYGNSSDIWALGVLLFELAALKHPFTSSQLEPLIGELKEGHTHKLPTQFSQEFHKLLDLLLNEVAEERATLNQIMDNSLVKPFLVQLLKHDEYKKLYIQTQSLRFFPGMSQVDPSVTKNTEQPESEHDQKWFEADFDSYANTFFK